MADHYTTLGIDPDATQDEIKSAYRKEARRVHPDHTGGGCEPFRAVREAYDVLSDPAQRQNYDEQLARERRIEAARRGYAPEPLRPRRGPVEPLVPDWQPGNTRDARSRGDVYEWLNELFGQPAPDRAAFGRRGGSPEEDLYAEVALTRAQAQRGGRVRLFIPARIVCPECGGQGVVFWYVCPECQGRGTVAVRTPVEVEFPAGIWHGYRGTVALDVVGMPGRMLTVRFSMQG